MLGTGAPLRLRILVDVLAAVTFLSLATAGWALWDRFQLTDSRRSHQTELNQRFAEADMRQVATLRTLLCFARGAALRRADTIGEAEQAQLFYDEALRRIHAKPC